MNSRAFLATYTGYDPDSLAAVNRHYNDGMLKIEGGCTLGFARYDDGNVGVVRNMDLFDVGNAVYDIVVYPDNKTVKYTTVGVVDNSAGDPYSYEDVLKKGIDDKRYMMIPFLTEDCLSYGGRYPDGRLKCLHTATLTRGPQFELDKDSGEYRQVWGQGSTWPSASLKCTQVSLNSIIAYNCCTIEEALKFVGAYRYDISKDPSEYERIYDVNEYEPQVDVYGMDMPSFNWSICIAMCDGKGNCGILECIEGRPIYIPCRNVDADPNPLIKSDAMQLESSVYSNFYMEKHYLLNDVNDPYLPKSEHCDNQYRENNVCGLGRYEAVLKHIDEIKTQKQHIDLMNTVDFKYYTKYDRASGWIGYEYGTEDKLGSQKGKPIDWRTEMSTADAWATMDYYSGMGADIDEINRVFLESKGYELKVSYYDSMLETVRQITYAEWMEDRGRYKCIYSTNLVLNPDYEKEVMDQIEWLGFLYNSKDTTDAIKHTFASTCFKTAALPSKGTLSVRYFDDDEDIDTFVIEDIANKGPYATEDELLEMINGRTQLRRLLS